MRTITIGDLLNKRQIVQATKLYRQFGSGGELHRQIVEQLILPNLCQINRNLDQENDPDYLAYAVEYIISQMK